MKTLFAIVFGLAVAAQAAAGPRHLKIATIAPSGSIYHRVLQEMGEACRRASGPGARAVVYADGLQGTETDTVRRMRVGQIDAAMLSVVGLIEIDPATAALQYMPMMFRSWAELEYARETLRPDFEAKFAAKGFVVLAWGEIGWVEFFMREDIATPEEFKRKPIFSWSEDVKQAGVMKARGFNPVPLPLADVLPAIQTGMLDVVPVSPMWALVGQYDRSLRYMLRIRWVPVIGATVMRRQTFEALTPAAREALLETAEKAAQTLRAHRDTQDESSNRALQARGMQVREMTPELERVWQAEAEGAWPLIRGNMVPADTFDKVVAALAEYRSRQ
jgi:TRAP-type C4-dicarboxylate transport system substrate-binding protein